MLNTNRQEPLQLNIERSEFADLWSTSKQWIAIHHDENPLLQQIVQLHEYCSEIEAKSGKVITALIIHIGQHRQNGYLICSIRHLQIQLSTDTVFDAPKPLQATSDWMRAYGRSPKELLKRLVDNGMAGECHIVIRHRFDALFPVVVSLESKPGEALTFSINNMPLEDDLQALGVRASKAMSGFFELLHKELEGGEV